MLTGDSHRRRRGPPPRHGEQGLPGRRARRPHARVRPPHRPAAHDDRAAHQGVGEPDRRQHGLLQRAQRLLHPPRAQPLALGPGPRRRLPGRQGGPASPTGRTRRPSSPPSRTRSRAERADGTAGVDADGSAADRTRRRDAAADGASRARCVRRAPFSDNPHVGARGQRTQQRILDAALRVFGEEGYHQCSIDRITELRRVLAGVVLPVLLRQGGRVPPPRRPGGPPARARRPRRSGSITPDADGWRRSAAWVARYAEIYERYEPVFQAFQAAAESDDAVAGGSVRTGERHVAALPVPADGRPPCRPASSTR